MKARLEVIDEGARFPSPSFAGLVGEVMSGQRTEPRRLENTGRLWGIAAAVTAWLWLFGGHHVSADTMWLMVFTTPRGEAILARVEPRDLFRGNSALRDTEVLTTKSFCRMAWQEASSRRLVTLEIDGPRDVIRTYQPNGAPLWEHRLPAESPRPQWACLSDRGHRVACVDWAGGLWFGDIERNGEPQFMQICQCRPAKGVGEWHRCVWVDKDTLAVQCGDGVYSVDTAQREAVQISGDHLVRRAAASVVGTGALCSGGFRFSDIDSGELIGWVRAGHSYSNFIGLSPCGQYVLYRQPALLLGLPRIVIHHIQANGTACLELSLRWRLGSWTKQEDDGAEQQAP